MAHWGELPGFDPAQPLEPAQRLEWLLAAPLTGRPGQGWRYSSPGYLVVAAVLAHVTQLPYPELVENHIIGPLKLTATTVGTPLAGEAALGYRHGQPVTPWQLHAMPGTGDICSDATDLARFITALHTGALLPPQLQPLLHGLAVPQRPQPRESASRASADRPPSRITSTEYCAGHFHGTIDGQPAYLHPGDNPGYQSLAAWLPDTATVIVTLSNHEDDDIEQAVADLARQIRPARNGVTQGYTGGLACITGRSRAALPRLSRCGGFTDAEGADDRAGGRGRAGHATVGDPSLEPGEGRQRGQRVGVAVEDGQVDEADPVIQAHGQVPHAVGCLLGEFGEHVADQ